MIFFGIATTIVHALFLAIERQRAMNNVIKRQDSMRAFQKGHPASRSHGPQVEK
jgi:hypothetical protein